MYCMIFFKDYNNDNTNVSPQQFKNVVSLAGICICICICICQKRKSEGMYYLGIKLKDKIVGE